MNVLQLEGDSDGKPLVLPAAIGSAIPAAVAGISFTMVYIDPPSGITPGIHALFRTVLQRGVLVVVAGDPGDCLALWTVFVNSTKIRGSVLLSCQCTTSTRSHHNLLWGVQK